MFYGVDTASLSDAIQSANIAVRRLSMQAGRDPRLGTTLAAVLLSDHSAIIAHVGDSRVYLIRQGSIEQVTRDHSLLQEQLQTGMITPDQVDSFAKKNVITRSMGQHNVVQADFTTISEMQPDDILLLCSDGLTNMVKDEEIAHIACHNQPEQAVHMLVNLANERGGPDNITVEIIHPGLSSVSAHPDSRPQRLSSLPRMQHRGFNKVVLALMALFFVVVASIGVTMLFFWN
jgi:protein phosphatase